jgi:hypothetical protein
MAVAGCFAKRFFEAEAEDVVVGRELMGSERSGEENETKQG